MTYTATDAGIINRALQVLGTRTNVTTTELNSLGSNEAIQANLIYTAYRDQLLRMAPWNCGMAYTNLFYLTSQPGTPENTSPFTTLWSPGQPPLGWAYEYMYPDDCVRACFIIPAMLTGFAGGPPIFPMPTSLGTAPTIFQGPAIKYKAQLDQYFRQVNGLIINPIGTGYQVGDTVVFGGAPSVLGSVPGGLLQVSVVTVNGSGGITETAPAPFANLGKHSLLYNIPPYTLSQLATSGFGSGAGAEVVSLFTPQFSARTILTNQEFATLAYVKQVTDPNVMDPDFVEAWINVLGAGLTQALTGDKELANSKILLANTKIMEARKTDGNEGLTVNDITPDFIRVRGIDFPPYMNGAWNGFDWGPSWPLF